MKKVLILNKEDKYCKDCGTKCRISLQNEFDSKTGKQHALYVCANRNCMRGQLWTCTDGGNHNTYPVFFSIFASERCSKCNWSRGIDLLAGGAA